MRVIKVFGPADLRVVDAPEPVPGEGQVLLTVKGSGICGSDKWAWRATGPVDHVPGHEVAGEVVALGPGVRGLSVGDRVAVNNVVGCGTCPSCRAGRFVRCAQRPGKDVGNGFSEYVVAPERNCMPLHESISFEAGCLIFDNWGTPFTAVERGGVGEGDDVVISGCGPIGLGAIALAKLRGAFVIAVDKLPYRLDAAIRMGADAVVPAGEDAVKAIRELTGGAGASIVIECSGKGPAYATGLYALRVGGSLVSVGEGAEYALRPSEVLIHRHLSILGSWYSTMAQGRAIQELILQGKINPTAFVTHRATIEEMPTAFRRTIECTDGVLKTVMLG